MFKAALPLVLISAMLISPSCIFDPKQDKEPPPEVKIDWPDMTSRDDVIEMLVLTYANPKNPESIVNYRALLHSQYFFGLAPQDVEPGEQPLMTRSDDVTSTEAIFEYEIVLELKIDPMVATWYEYPELEGEPCENCWASQPSYFIKAQFDDEDPIFQSPVENSEVSIIVAPDENDPTKWVLRAMYDLCITN